MPAGFSILWKYYTPGPVPDPADKLSIDEISDSSQCQGQYGRNAQDIGNSPKIELLFTAIEPGSSDDAQEPSMKTHPSLPYFKQVEWMEKIDLRVAKNHKDPCSYK